MPLVIVTDEIVCAVMLLPFPFDLLHSSTNIVLEETDNLSYQMKGKPFTCAVDTVSHLSFLFVNM